MAGEVVHFEIPYVKRDRAKKFYSEIFGWKLKDESEMEYTLVSAGPVDENGRLTQPGMINGGMMKRMPKVKAPVVYMSVDDIETTMKKIVEMGGKKITEKTAVQDMGWSAYFQDSEGNVLGMFQTNPEFMRKMQQQ